jgi:hypothetical protein
MGEIGKAEAFRRDRPGWNSVHHTKNRHRKFPPRNTGLNATTTGLAILPLRAVDLYEHKFQGRKLGVTQFREH